MRNILLKLGLAFLCPVLIAQQALNNDGVIKLIKAGLSDDLIVTTINGAPGNYDISADAIVALKNAGASDKAIAAIIAKASGASAPSSATPATSPGPSAMPNNTVPPAPVPEADPGTVKAFGPIHAGARIVIAPMGGFETYFAAAVREKQVPITLTLDKTSAQYFVVSTNTEWQGFVFGAGGSASWNRSGGTAASGASASSTRGLEASIMLIDAGSKDVIWAYEVHKNSHGSLLFGTFGARGQQSIAESCAKHLKEYIEKGK
ncbi:hypothetical protein [Terracidiphilus sp.]|jgi:hypothetical protein|uniref:hypothetical protein n=1 Tax=Terracidiphilus sp. TaxID=1964191 RepID=UPI003C1C2664